VTKDQHDRVLCCSSEAGTGSHMLSDSLVQAARISIQRSSQGSDWINAVALCLGRVVAFSLDRRHQLDLSLRSAPSAPSVSRNPHDAGGDRASRRREDAALAMTDFAATRMSRYQRLTSHSECDIMWVKD
jgi:hypothetical protein